MSVALHGTASRVDVIDSDNRMPAFRGAQDDDTSGRGLGLVDTLSQSWGVEPRDSGKSVWFCLDLAQSSVDVEGLLMAFDSV